jgi:hypothetical protein
MRCDDYVPEMILSHMTRYHAEIKYVHVLTSVDCDFNTVALVISTAWPKYRVCVGISH